MALRSVTMGKLLTKILAPYINDFLFVYIDDLIKLLRKSGLGCRIDNFFYGVLGYADDLLLLSASRTGLQAMVAICEKFAKSRRLKFSTDDNPAKSKTKAIVFNFFP